MKVKNSYLMELPKWYTFIDQSREGEVRGKNNEELEIMDQEGINIMEDGADPGTIKNLGPRTPLYVPAFTLLNGVTITNSSVQL